MTLIKEINDDLKTLTENKDEINRIAAHWKENRKDLTDTQLSDIIANELEQLEYNPQQLQSALKQILSLLK